MDNFDFEQKLDNWKEETNKNLKEHDDRYRVVTSGWYKLFVFFGVIGIILFLLISSYFVYLIQQGAFHLSVNNEINSPPVNITSYNNNYKNDIYLNVTLQMPVNLIIGENSS